MVHRERERGKVRGREGERKRGRERESIQTGDTDRGCLDPASD